MIGAHGQPRRWIHASEAAQLLGVELGTVYRWAGRGVFKVWRPSLRCVLIDAESFGQLQADSGRLQQLRRGVLPAAKKPRKI